MLDYLGGGKLKLDKEKIKAFFLKFKNIHALIGLGIIIFGIFIDQLTKRIIVSNMEIYDSYSVIGEFFEITYIRNTGAAWGLFSDSYVFLGIITIIALAIFMYLMSEINFKNKKVYSFSVVLMISGTIGNLIDRTARALFNGLGVIDFLDFNIFGYDFPIFNVADILLVVGVALFAIYTLILSDKTKKEINQDDFNDNDSIVEANESLGDDNEDRNERE